MRRATRLGLAHNFAASSVSQSDSVMDYPHPYVTLDKDGAIDTSHAYADHIGDWDKVAIDYGYRQFAPKTDVDAALEQDSDATPIRAGRSIITDEDARPFGSAHPHAHLWDNGTDPAAELDRVLAGASGCACELWRGCDPARNADVASLSLRWCRSICFTAIRPRLLSRRLAGLTIVTTIAAMD